MYGLDIAQKVLWVVKGLWRRLLARVRILYF